MQSISYRAVTDSISEDRMQFVVTHFHPEYSADDAGVVKADIMERLFAVFSGMQCQTELGPGCCNE